MMLRTNVSWRRGIHALILAGAILLAIGGGSALAAPSCAPSGVDTVCTFSTPGADTFTVPAGVTEASFDLFGAQGGSVDGFFAGLGGRASAELALTPGATLTVVVGGAGGSTPGCSVQPGRAGGVNGGAPGGSGACEGPGGGGASDVRIGGTGLSDRVLVAGGGGGGANVFTDPAPVGGGGGGLTGQAGSEAGGPAGSGGSGGDQTGASGSGLLGVGSPGADGSPVCCIVPVSGGGGGGGYYGGAGGQPNQGGGGGSGFGPPGVVFETGVRAGDGLVTITYQTPLTFGGFRQPVDNPPTVNTGRAGRTYPVKFQVRDQNGAVVTSLAAVSSITHKKVACGAFTGDPTDSLETEATGGTSLRFDGDQFIYNWKTPTVAGCYELFVTLADGGVHSAARSPGRAATSRPHTLHGCRRAR